MMAIRLMVGVSLFGLDVIAFVSVKDCGVIRIGIIDEYVRSVRMANVFDFFHIESLRIESVCVELLSGNVVNNPCVE